MTMFKPMTQKLHEAHFGSVMPVTLPEPGYARFHPLPEPDDPNNFGPVAAQTTFGAADANQQNADAVLDTVPIRTLLGRCLSRLMRLQALEFIENSEKRLQPLRGALGTAFGLAAIEETLMTEFMAAVEEQHEETLRAGKAKATALAKLREELLAADVAFENSKEAAAAAERELKIRRGEPLDRWAGKRERAARQKELDGVQQRIDLLRAQTAQAVEMFNAKQAAVEQAQAELVEIDRAERRLRAMLDGNRFAVDPEFGLSVATGNEPMPKGFPAF